MRFILGFIIGLVLVSSSQAGIIRLVTYPVRHPVKTFHCPARATAKTAKIVWKIVY